MNLEPVRTSDRELLVYDMNLETPGGADYKTYLQAQDPGFVIPRSIILHMKCTDQRDDAMAPAAPWGDLHSELLVSIAAANSMSLRDYTSLRGVCTAWRSAIEPPSYYPCLLTLANDDHGRHYSASVYSLPMRRSFHLQTPSSALDVSRDHDRDLYRRARIVGSSNGCFAVAVDQERAHFGVAKFLTCSTTSIVVLDPRAGKEVEIAAPAASRTPCCEYEYVHKVVFAPGGTVIVALWDRRYVAYIDVATSRDKWTTIDVNMVYVADLAFGEDGKLYCLDPDGGVHVVCIPAGGSHNGEQSAVVEPLPAGTFVPPYDFASRVMTAKNLFFCHGSLYQVWQNSSATVTSGGLRICAGMILVLRYDPKRLPCWDVVKDLGGCSVFIGKYNCATVVRAEGVRGVRADCVYWIDWTRPMVCDIATGISKPHVLPYGACQGNCWYFDDNNMTGIHGDMRKGVK